MIKLLSLHQPSLLLLLEECANTEKAPKSLHRFLTALSKNVPLFGFTHFSHEIINILTDLSSGNDILVKNNPHKMIKLMEEIPAVYEIILQFSQIPESFKMVFAEMIAILKKTFGEGGSHSLTPCKSSDELAFFPALPQKVERGSYSCDQLKLFSQADCDKVKNLKRKKGHPTLTPGLFTLNCCHG